MIIQSSGSPNLRDWALFQSQESLDNVFGSDPAPSQPVLLDNAKFAKLCKDARGRSVEPAGSRARPDPLRFCAFTTRYLVRCARQAKLLDKRFTKVDADMRRGDVYGKDAESDFRSGVVKALLL